MTDWNLMATAFSLFFVGTVLIGWAGWERRRDYR